MSRKKDCTEPGKNSVAGAGPLGRSGPGGWAGMEGRAGMGARDGGTGQPRQGSGGSACSFIKHHDA